jgi:hypothetical protein
VTATTFLLIEYSSNHYGRRKKISVSKVCMVSSWWMVAESNALEEKYRSSDVLHVFLLLLDIFDN